MGILPARESYAANQASALDCNLIIAALDEGARIGQGMARPSMAVSSAPLKVGTAVRGGVRPGARRSTASTVGQRYRTARHLRGSEERTPTNAARES